MSARRRGARSCTARTITATDALRRLPAAGRVAAFLAATALLAVTGEAAEAATGKAGVETASRLQATVRALEKAGESPEEKNASKATRDALKEVAETRSESARLYHAVATITHTPLPSLKTLQAECGADPLCAAARLAETLAPHARLQQTATPSTDAIRGVEKRASLQPGEPNADGWPTARLHRFGRDAVWEMRDFLAAARKSAAEGIALDLRGNGGGDFDRMLRIAALFCPPASAEVLLHHGASTRRFSLPSDTPAWGGSVRVWMDGDTASSAEILAALLKRCAAASLLGKRTAGKDILLREVAVRQGWRLLVPAGRLEVPGVSLSSGLLPDAP